ncbi:hypothetical protein GCM10010293_40760 [Streptomyces griseoflavus]|uniref:hypothetical protein n=1 Tax=Streptomyces griseoflavus TaxID=35619 RepID=UPI00167E83A7|nr:hypothetical protein [Streptomyces griseoflavus]GGV37087.1 hypothetical protein GCM10010293_40760 [Streptomyces griseoflavus]
MAATPDLPLWAWNLIIAIQRHEELHGKEDACLGGVLKAVPADVRHQAEAISSYVQKASGNQIADSALKNFANIMGDFFSDASPRQEEAVDG